MISKLLFQTFVKRTVYTNSINLARNAGLARKPLKVLGQKPESQIDSLENSFEENDELLDIESPVVESKQSTSSINSNSSANFNSLPRYEILKNNKKFL